MSNLYLSIRQLDVPKPQPISCGDGRGGDFDPQDEFREVFFPTPEHYREFRAGMRERTAASAAPEVPVFTESGSQAATGAVQGLGMDLTQMGFLFYCHETLEQDYVLPSLKIKRQFEMNDCISLMLSQSGSLASLSALRLAKSAMWKQTDKLGLLVVADRVEFAELRYQFTGYLRGDSASVMLLSSSAGDYRIVEARKFSDGIPLSYPLWKGSEYRLAEKLMSDHAKRLLEQAWSIHGRIDYVLCQRLSDAFCRAVEDKCRPTSTVFFVRRQWPDVNLLGNDPYASLRQLEREREIPPGSKLLLLFAGIDFGVGYVVLEK